MTTQKRTPPTPTPATEKPARQPKPKPKRPEFTQADIKRMQSQQPPAFQALCYLPVTILSYQNLDKLQSKDGEMPTVKAFQAGLKQQNRESCRVKSYFGEIKQENRQSGRSTRSEADLKQENFSDSETLELPLAGKLRRAIAKKKLELPEPGAVVWLGIYPRCTKDGSLRLSHCQVASISTEPPELTGTVSGLCVYVTNAKTIVQIHREGMTRPFYVTVWPASDGTTVSPGSFHQLVRLKVIFDAATKRLIFAEAIVNDTAADFNCKHKSIAKPAIEPRAADMQADDMQVTSTQPEQTEEPKTVTLTGTVLAVGNGKIALAIPGGIQAIAYEDKPPALIPTRPYCITCKSTADLPKFVSATLAAAVKPS